MKSPADQISPVKRKGKASTRIMETLRTQIRSGLWKPGDKLPSEPDLSAEMGASRGALRTALDQLESEGLVTRRHGSGTYVSSRQPLLNSLHVNHSADQMISATGRTAGTKLLTWKRVPAANDVAENLALQDNDDVLELHRIRTADGVPVTVSYDYLPVGLVSTQPAFLGASLYAFLSSACGIDVEFGVARLSPSYANTDIANALEVPVGSLCLTIHQVDHDMSGRPVSYSIEHHLASAFSFELLRHGPSSRREQSGSASSRAAR